MAREQYANLPVTTLDGGINNSTTTVVVDDGSKMPLANFRIVIELEIMFVTSRSSNTLTVIRAIESTSAASHADTTPVAAIITKGAMDQIALDTIYRSGSGMGRPSIAANADDDEFDDESFSGWTKVWQGSAPVVVETEQDHSVSLAVAAGGSAGQWAAWVKSKAPSAGNYIQTGHSAWGRGGGFPHLSCVFSDGTTYNAGNQVMYGYSQNEDVMVLRSLTGFNTQTAFNISSGSTLIRPIFNIVHQRMVYQGSNTWNCYFSPDGISWVPTHLGVSMGSMTPTHVGFAITSWGGNENVWNLKYVRFNY